MLKGIASQLGYVPGVGGALFAANFLLQRVLRVDASCPYSKHYTSRVLHPGGLEVEDECQIVLRSFAVSGGCYINAIDGLWIGKGTIWAPNVSIISQTHDISDFDLAPQTSGIRIGRRCWLGVGSVILPGVVLGDHTIVGANTVVSRSFPEGNQVIAGAPARVLRRLASQ